MRSVVSRFLGPFLGLVLVGSSTLLLALPAVGQEATEETPATPETTIFESDYVPAVVLPESAPADAAHPWTTRFLVPTTVAIGALAVFATVVQYFVRVVRSRYKVVE